MNFIWSIGLMASMLLILFTCNNLDFLSIASNSIFNSLKLCLQLGAIYIFWCGILEIVQNLNLHKHIASITKNVLSKIFPHTSKEAQENISTNIACNILGLSNASIPCGIQALEKIKHNTQSTNQLIILNSISLQLLPTTIISLFLSYGGTDFIKIWLLSVFICFLILILSIFLNLKICRKDF